MIVVKRIYRALFSMSSDTVPEPEMTDSGLGIAETSPPMMFADDFQKELESSPEWQEMEKSLKVILELLMIYSRSPKTYYCNYAF